MEDIATNPQITIVEIVLPRPSLRSELDSTENQGVEHTESEQQSFKLWEFVRLSLYKMGLIKLAKGSSDVGFKILWSLICNLQSILKNRLWNNFHQWETWWF